MRDYLTLLKPRLLSTLNRLKRAEKGAGGKLVFMGLVALLFWLGVFFGFYKALAYFQAAEGFGEILARKLMGMIWVTFFAILIFSNVITALSTFFLSKDLETIHSSPVSLESIFWARFTSTLVDSSWMVAFFGLPVFLAYGAVFKAGGMFYLALLLTALPMLVLAAAISVIFTQALVNAFPAQRTKDLLILLSIAMAAILYLLFRFMRPERLVNPDAFGTMVSYFASLSTPASPWLPSYWATEALWPFLSPRPFARPWFWLAALTSTAAAAAVAASWVSNLIYASGFTKAQEASRRFITSNLNPLELITRLAGWPLAAPSRALVAKEIKTFFRDNSQWPQLLLLIALVVVYLYNFKALDLKRSPFPTFYLQNFISFLNIGLASFVVASLGVRFVFPAVSLEGFSYWIIRTSPLSLKRFLWTKFFIYAPPLVLIAEVLIMASNYLLDAEPFMMILSGVTIFFLTLGIVAIGIGLGAAYPRFESENIVQVATGFGGMMFMITAAIFVGLVVVLEAWPVYVIFTHLRFGRDVETWKWIIIGLCFAAVVALNALAVWLPMKIGLNRLSAREGE